MKTRYRKYLLCLLSVACTATTSWGGQIINPDSLTQLLKKMRIRVENRSLAIYDIRIAQKGDITDLFQIPEHPGFESRLTPEIKHDILSKINNRHQELGKDTLLSSEYFYVWKPYFDWLHNEDPHYQIAMLPAFELKVYKNSKRFNNASGSRRLPFLTLNVNDTIIINKSYDPLFRKGDMITSINGVTMSEYLKYSYADRYSSPLALMLNYYFSFAVDKFSFDIQRDGQEIKIETNGVTAKEVGKFLMAEEYDVQLFSDYNSGYIQIKRFYPYNNRLIKTVRKAIVDFKKEGLRMSYLISG